MNRLLSGRRSTALHVALWLVPLAAVVWWATKQQTPTFPDSPGAIAWLAGSLLVYAVVTLVRGERWDRILRLSEVRVKRVDAYGLTCVGYAGNNVLPARGGELLRVFLLSGRTGASRRTVLGTILAERALDAIALVGILLVVAFNLVEKLGTPSGTLLLVGGALLLGLVIAAIVAWGRYRHHVHRAIEALRPLTAPLWTLLSPMGAALLVVSVLIWILEATVYLMVAESVGIHLGLAGAMSVVAFTNLAALIPAAPGYIGTYDAAVVFATKAVTKSATNVVSYLIMLRFVLFVPITVVGFGFLFLRYGGLQRLRAAREAAREDATGIDVPVALPAPEPEPVKAPA